MTAILTSIKNLKEAKIIKDMPIDIIDVKNVHDGALGFVGINEAIRIHDYLGQKTLSITMGDYKNPALRKCIENASLIDKIGYKFIKLGLFESSALKYHQEFLNKITFIKAEPVCVLFADKTFNFGNLRKVIEIGYRAVMIDTCFKKNKTVDLLSYKSLVDFVDYCKKNNIICGISGSVAISDLAYLVEINPDFIGLRGQLCSPEKGRAILDKQQVSFVLNEFDYALNNSNNGRTLSKVSLYSNSTSES